MPSMKPYNIVFLYCPFILFDTDNEHVSLNTLETAEINYIVRKYSFIDSNIMTEIPIILTLETCSF